MRGVNNMKTAYLVIVGIILIVAIGIFVYKNQFTYEWQGRIIFPASPVMAEGYNCEGFQPEGITNPDTYLQRWQIEGNYISLCSNQSLFDFNESSNVIVKGNLQKTADGRGYIIADFIEQAQ